MKPTTKDVLLKIYYVFQCFAVVLNFVFFILGIIISFVTFILFNEYQRTNIENYIFIGICIFLNCIILCIIFTSIISTISTKNILQNKPLTKPQKFSAVIFPIITVPLYLYLIFKLFIQYR